MGSAKISRDEFLDTHLPELRRISLFLFADDESADREVISVLGRLTGRRVNPDRVLKQTISSLLKRASVVRPANRSPDEGTNPRRAMLQALSQLDAVDRALLADVDADLLSLPTGEAAERGARARAQFDALLPAAGTATDPRTVAEDDSAAADSLVVAPVAMPRTVDHAPFRRPVHDA